MIEFAQQKSQAQTSHLVSPIRLDGAMLLSVRAPNPHLVHQHAIGNQAVQQILRSRAIQAKLVVNEPGDEYEREADHVAEQVMIMPEPVAPEQVQRACPECVKEARTQPEEEEKVQAKPIAEMISPVVQQQVESEEDKEETIQTKQDGLQVHWQGKQKDEGERIQTKRTDAKAQQVTRGLEVQIESVRGRGGQPLPESARRFFEPRFEYDFSDVRMHSDEFASGLAKSLDARAFTVGRDIIFGKEQNGSEIIERKNLLSHELAHIIQQDRQSSMNNIQRKDKGNAEIPINPEIDLELILGPIEEKSIVLRQEVLLELYKYLKILRRLAPKEEPLVKYLLKRYFQNNWEKIWIDSRRPLAGYKGTSHGKSGKGFNILAGASKALEKAEELGIIRISQRTWKKFLGSDVIFLSGHHYARYGSPGEFSIDDPEYYINFQDLKFVSQNAKLVIISSCAGLYPNVLKLWKKRFPNAYILGWRSGSPENQRGMMREFLGRLPEDLILERKKDIEKVINEWEAYIEYLAKTSRTINPRGLGYVTPEGSAKWYTQSKGKWFWAKKQ